MSEPEGPVSKKPKLSRIPQERYLWDSTDMSSDVIGIVMSYTLLPVSLLWESVEQYYLDVILSDDKKELHGRAFAFDGDGFRVAAVGAFNTCLFNVASRVDYFFERFLRGLCKLDPRDACSFYADLNHDDRCYEMTDENFDCDDVAPGTKFATKMNKEQWTEFEYCEISGEFRFGFQESSIQGEFVRREGDGPFSYRRGLLKFSSSADAQLEGLGLRVDYDDTDYPAEKTVLEGKFSPGEGRADYKLDGIRLRLSADEEESVVHGRFDNGQIVESNCYLCADAIPEDEADVDKFIYAHSDNVCRSCGFSSRDVVRKMVEVSETMPTDLYRHPLHLVPMPRE